MELSARKKLILKTVINDYIRTAEPVGSKALASRPELRFSSATIRNEMSELEEMGYLEKPHTSAGRIPSPAGYRLYVDELMGRTDLSVADVDRINSVMKLKVKELDRMVSEAGKLISNLTDYTTLAVTPYMQRVTIRKFHHRRQSAGFCHRRRHRQRRGQKQNAAHRNAGHGRGSRAADVCAQSDADQYPY